jgi:predicted phosphodiesterase
MILGVVSDVHGNLPALEAVLSDMGRVDALLGCGDFVGYYPDAAEVVDRLRRLDIHAVRGNHELMAAGVAPVPEERAGYYRIDRVREVLPVEALAWLRALPPSLVLPCDGLTIELRHASPWDEETYLHPDCAALERIELPADRWLFLGHTHHPMRVRRGAGWVVNPGSVGQPRDWDPRAAYGVLDTRARTWEQRRVAYDHRAYQRRLERLGWDARTIALLGRERTVAVPA